MMGAGKMLRLRGFNADPEWRGKWADNDAAWTNQLRQLLARPDLSWHLHEALVAQVELGEVSGEAGEGGEGDEGHEGWCVGGGWYIGLLGHLCGVGGTEASGTCRALVRREAGPRTASV